MLTVMCLKNTVERQWYSRTAGVPNIIMCVCGVGLRLFILALTHSAACCRSGDMWNMLHEVSPKFAVKRPPGPINTPSSLAAESVYQRTPFSMAGWDSPAFSQAGSSTPSSANQLSREAMYNAYMEVLLQLETPEHAPASSEHPASGSKGWTPATANWTPENHCSSSQSGYPTPFYNQNTPPSYTPVYMPSGSGQMLRDTEATVHTTPGAAHHHHRVRSADDLQTTRSAMGHTPQAAPMPGSHALAAPIPTRFCRQARQGLPCELSPSQVHHSPELPARSPSLPVAVTFQADTSRHLPPGMPAGSNNTGIQIHGQITSRPPQLPVSYLAADPSVVYDPTRYTSPPRDQGPFFATMSSPDDSPYQYPIAGPGQTFGLQACSPVKQAGSSSHTYHRGNDVHDITLQLQHCNIHPQHVAPAMPHGARRRQWQIPTAPPRNVGFHPDVTCQLQF